MGAFEFLSWLHQHPDGYVLRYTIPGTSQGVLLENQWVQRLSKNRGIY